MDWQNAQISNMSRQRRVPLHIAQPTIIEMMQNLKDLDGLNLRELVRTNENLEFIRNLLNWKKTKNLTILLDKLTHPILESTPVNEKLEQFAKNLLSSNKMYTRKSLDIPKNARKPKNICDTIVKEDDCQRFIRRFLMALKFEDLIGEKNLNILVEWITNIMFSVKDEKQDTFPNIDFKTAPIARCFKTKQVCSKVPHQGDKRALQIFIVKNVISIAGFVVIYKLMKTFRYVQHDKTKVNCWKIGVQKYLTKEKKSFMQRYCLKLLPENTKITKIPRIKFTISKNSLRPIYYAPKRSDWATSHFYQEVNAVLEFICEKQGCQFESIRATLTGLRQFLVRKMKQFVDLGKMKLQTADISKCFSTIEHKKMMEILENWTPKGLIFIKVGWAQSTKPLEFNRAPLRIRICAAGSSEHDAKQLLIFKAKRKEAKIVDFKDVKIFTKEEILKTFGNVLNGFGVRIAMGNYKVTKGVPQGHALSPSLANIYLAYFERKCWSEIIKTDEVFVGRYFDDFLMCATDQSNLDFLMNSLTTPNEYGLYAKKTKCKTSKRGSSIIWCGKSIEFYKLASLIGQLMREQTYI